MTKKVKNFLIAFLASVVSFVASLIIQYYFTVVTSIELMVAIAIWCGLLVAIIVAIIRILEQEKEFSLSIFILKIFMTFTTISMIFLLSTLGNQVVNNISIICFGIGGILSVICLLYTSIKEVIKVYKKYKEKQ